MASVAFCERSDLTIAGFCETIGVSVQSFYKWRRRLGDKDESIGPLPTFVPVTLPDSIEEFEFSGAIARVPNKVDALPPVVHLLLELGVQQ